MPPTAAAALSALQPDNPGWPPRGPPSFWRFTNAGFINWRPTVSLTFYSDKSCTQRVPIPAFGGWQSAAS